MDWLSELLRRLWMLMRRQQFDADLKEEMRLRGGIGICGPPLRLNPAHPSNPERSARGVPFFTGTLGKFRLAQTKFHGALAEPRRRSWLLLTNDSGYLTDHRLLREPE